MVMSTDGLERIPEQRTDLIGPQIEKFLQGHNGEAYTLEEIVNGIDPSWDEYFEHQEHSYVRNGGLSPHYMNLAESFGRLSSVYNALNGLVADGKIMTRAINSMHTLVELLPAEKMKDGKPIVYYYTQADKAEKVSL